MNDGDATRRGALKALAVAGGAVACGALGAPAIEVLVAPAASEAGTGARWIRTAKLDALPEGQPKKIAIVSDNQDAWMVEKNVELGAVWLIRRGDAIQCFSVTCPHLGCSIAALPDGGFNCPCHDSNFDAKGERTGGPSPRNMDTLETRVESGYVLVDFHKFRQGTPDRIRIA